MPENSNTVIFLGQKKLEAFEVYKDSVSDILTMEWEAKTLPQALAKVASKIEHSSVRILVGDNLAFLSPIFIKVSSENLKDEVLSKAQEILPESIDELGVDWKKVGQVKDTYAIQIFAMQKSFLSLLGHSAQSAGLEISSIEPVAYVLSRAVPGESEPHLVVWADESVFAAVCYQGQVLASTLITSMDINNQIQALIDFIKEKYELDVSTGYVAKTATKINVSELAALTKIQINSDDIDLIHLAANKPDTSGPDENILNITPEEAFPDEDFSVEEKEDNKEEVEEDVQESEEDNIDEEDKADSQPEPVALVKLAAPALPKPKTPTVLDNEIKEEVKTETLEINMSDTNEKISSSAPSHEFKLNVSPARADKKNNLKSAIFLVLGLVVLSLMIVGGVFLYIKTTGNKPEIAPEVQVTATPTPSPSPTPAPEIDKTSVKIQIQNGSGVVGRAGKVGTVLEDAGFNKADTANADNYDYDKTEISVKKGNQALLDSLVKELEGSYVIGDTNTTLEEDSDFDAVITVGKSLAVESSKDATTSAKTDN